MALFHKNYRETPARRVFKVFNYIFCTLIACLCLFPMLHILALSFSRSEFVNTNQVVLWPKGFNTFAYRDLKQVMNEKGLNPCLKCNAPTSALPDE